MAEIGARMFQHTGTAGYISMAFYTYPYITILQPELPINVFLETKSHEFINRVLTNLMPQLGVTDPVIVSDMYRGVAAFGYIQNRINVYLKNYQMPKKLENPPQEFVDLVKESLTVKGRSLCPPMGIQLNIRKMLKLFIQEDFRFEFYDLMALKTFLAFQICFDEDPAKFGFAFTYPKTAFVAPWIFGLFWNFVQTMDIKEVFIPWNITQETFPDNWLIPRIYNLVDIHIELRCVLDLSEELGYLPDIRYLISTQENPQEYVHLKRQEIIDLFAKTKRWFSHIPPSEIGRNPEEFGKLIFGRDVHVDVLMPLVSGILDESAASDKLDFGKDHLRNALTARKYTVEKARQNWLGSTNTEPTPKWWAHGQPGDMRSELFDVRQA